MADEYQPVIDLGRIEVADTVIEHGLARMRLVLYQRRFARRRLAHDQMDWRLPYAADLETRSHLDFEKIRFTSISKSSWCRPAIMSRAASMLAAFAFLALATLGSFSLKRTSTA